jgi:hypothetical protein
MKKLQLLMLTGLLVMTIGCTRVQHAAVAGGVMGAMTGAIIGHHSGDAGEGAAIGAGVGALVGALAQDYADHADRTVVHEYHVRHVPPPPPRYYRGRRVRPRRSYDRQVWVPGHYAGGIWIEGHWEKKHIVGGYRRTVYVY